MGFFRFRISCNKHFAGVLLKKTSEKNFPFLDQNHGLTPLENCQLFLFFLTFCFSSLEGVFSFYDIEKKNSYAILPLKKKVGKMAIYGLKPWV